MKEKQNDMEDKDLMERVKKWGMEYTGKTEEEWDQMAKNDELALDLAVTLYQLKFEPEKLDGWEKSHE